MPLESARVTEGSNLYLLEHRTLFLLVDIGMDPGRIGVVAALLDAADPGRTKPLLVVLTHCHYDHVAAAPALDSCRPRPCLIAGHAAGVAPLAARDPVLTISYLFRSIPPRVESTIPLFDSRHATAAPLRIPCAGGAELTLTVPAAGQGSRLLSQDLCVDGLRIARMYATPGHSPDSICLQAGSCFFCGDLPFAANPAVAGIPGWSRADLIQSLEEITGLIRMTEGLLFCSGHTPPVSRDVMIEQLVRARHAAGRLKGVVTVDADRVAFLKRYAAQVLEEACGAFTIISGQLLLVAEQLELLDEAERSRAIRESADLDILDSLVEKFAGIAGRAGRAGEPETSLPMATAAILAKTDRMLDTPLVSGIIDPVRIRRVRNLIVDFRNALQGIVFRELLRPEHPGELLQALAARLTAVPYDDAALMASANDHDSFMTELVRRLACRPLFVGIAFQVSCQENLPMVAVEREHLLDTLTGICELLAISGAPLILCTAAAGGDQVTLSLSAPLQTDKDLLSGRKAEYYAATLQLYGASFHIRREDGHSGVIMTLPAADACEGKAFQEPIV